MANSPLRVVVWATGGIGSIAIHAIQRRPDIELVGVWVHAQEKVGKDAGELANGEPIGLTATNDPDALLYASGIEPGFAADYLPLVLSTQSSSIEKIRAFEIGLYDDYGVPDIMSNALGFGQPPDYQPWIGFPGAIAGEWQGQIRLIADTLGVEVQEVRESFDRAATNRTLNVAMGTVEAGTCGAIRMRAIGVVDGREAIVIEHVTRLAHDVAPIGPPASAICLNVSQSAAIPTSNARWQRLLKTRAGPESPE
jgi:hypothetical protein